jgi:hypothetical protein
LPDFIEASIALMYPNASDAKIAEIRAEWAEQIAFNQKSAAQTNGTVLHSSQSLSIAYMSTFIKTEDLWGGLHTTQQIWWVQQISIMPDFTHH